MLLLILIFFLNSSSLGLDVGSFVLNEGARNFFPINLNKSSIPWDDIAEVDLKIALISWANSIPSFKLTSSNSYLSLLFPAIAKIISEEAFSFNSFIQKSFNFSNESLLVIS